MHRIMIKCWMLEAEGRPSFKELADVFANMARDPGLYLVIPGDKLMRLPSYSPKVSSCILETDSRLICLTAKEEKAHSKAYLNLSSSTRYPEMIMDVEEYKYRAPLPSTSTVETSLPPALQ